MREQMYRVALRGEFTAAEVEQTEHELGDLGYSLNVRPTPMLLSKVPSRELSAHREARERRERRRARWRRWTGWMVSR
jgi:anti-sigma-K factor RskA